VRAEALSTANAGMTRLRRKGNASPATLYDCLNAYITIAGTVKPRPGTIVDNNLPPGTKGLVSHKGKLIVFSHVPVTISNTKYESVTLRHPIDSKLAIRAIHFAAPFMGFLYVVAAFEDGSQYHFWAEELDAWEADKNYIAGDRIFPTIPNGFAYKATRIGSPNPVWGPRIERSVNDVIEPTVHDGFKYTVIAVSGTKPASGEIEPVWPAEDGAVIIEESAGAISPDPIPGGEGIGFDIGSIDERYGNPGGSRPVLRTRIG